MAADAISEPASRAVEMAQRLVLQDVSDDEAVAGLLASGISREALREAASFMGPRSSNGYPAAPMHRLLLTAAGEPVSAPTLETAAAEARQRQLLEQPREISFQQLADQVPGLRDLERRASTDPEGFLPELTAFERSSASGGPEEPGAAKQFRIALGIRRAVSRIVGPFSGNPDPVAASPWAEDPVTRHLWKVARIDQTGWA